MPLRWTLLALMTLALLDSSPAVAKKRRAVAVDPCSGTLADFFRLECPPERRWNGKSPPVYVNGVFVGQDPDRNVRFQMMREYLTKTERH